MNHEEVWLEEIEWIDDDDALDELLEVLVAVTDDRDEDAGARA